MERKPNHICMNGKCPYGENGFPKKYYACDYCDRTSYRVVACSPECYAEVMKHLNPEEYNKPNRSDKTQEEIEKIMTAPLDDISASSKEELSDYADEIKNLGIERVVDIINEEIDSKKSKRKKK